MQIQAYFPLLTKIVFKLKGIHFFGNVSSLHNMQHIYVYFFVRHFDYQKLYVHTSKYFAIIPKV